jgi:predicted CXXCH cytochrome family protein
MKKLYFFLTFAFLIFLSQFGNAQITGSSHDFSAAAWNTSNNEICIVCHTPHNATILPDAPLWNHALSAVTNYTLYASGTLNATMGQPDGSSKLCLSCHDGTVAIENYGGVTSGATFMSGGPLLGTALSNDHPVSFLYDAALAGADPGLQNPTTALSGLGGTINQNMLISGRMQCSSCHDVHNGAGIVGLLLKSNSHSALCLTCHIK